MSLLRALDTQMSRLCEVAGVRSPEARPLLADLLGAAGSRPVSAPPLWPSGIADDHSPVEFSVAFDDGGRAPTVRILGESLDAAPSVTRNGHAARAFVHQQAARFGLATSQFEQVWKLFATNRPAGEFMVWHSLVLRDGRTPEFKVYFNPEVQGEDRSVDLVREGLRRLGCGASFDSLLGRVIRPGAPSRDRLTFFALDLHDAPHNRVKLYLSHHDARVEDAVRAAGVVDGVDTDVVAEFCEMAAGPHRVMSGRPLVSSYSYLGGGAEPAGYSVYVPIRSYVSDDQEAFDRTRAILERFGFDATLLDRLPGALTDRPLRDGVGLIAHVSLRLGPPRPGVTVYLSAEAYDVFPPRTGALATGLDQIYVA